MLGTSVIKDLIQNSKLFDRFALQKVSSWGKGKVMSYGLIEAGYDIRLAKVYRTYPTGKYIDPKDPDSVALVELRDYSIDETGQFFIAEPFGTYLGVSLEHIAMPDNIKAVVSSKSSYARCHVIAHVTPIEPGWHGYLTIELVNLSAHPVKVYLNEGFVSLMFFDIGEDNPYTGGYQGQGARAYVSGEDVEEEF